MSLSHSDLLEMGMIKEHMLIMETKKHQIFQFKLRRDLVTEEYENVYKGNIHLDLQVGDFRYVGLDVFSGPQKKKPFRVNRCYKSVRIDGLLGRFWTIIPSAHLRTRKLLKEPEFNRFDVDTVTLHSDEAAAFVQEVTERRSTTE